MAESPEGFESRRDAGGHHRAHSQQRCGPPCPEGFDRDDGCKGEGHPRIDRDEDAPHRDDRPKEHAEMQPLIAGASNGETHRNRMHPIHLEEHPVRRCEPERLRRLFPTSIRAHLQPGPNKRDETQPRRGAAPVSPHRPCDDFGSISSRDQQHEHSCPKRKDSIAALTGTTAPRGANRRKHEELKRRTKSRPMRRIARDAGCSIRINGVPKPRLEGPGAEDPEQV